ncbi:hypothetical protein JCM11251_000914 [Rhodosporidiobolus azoricus]
MRAASEAPTTPPRSSAGNDGPTRSRLDNLERALQGPLNDATDKAQQELRRLAQYEAPEAKVDFPKNRLAAVLVLLHLNPLGELSVTLTTRSKTMRSHPGETALPGGKWDEGDGEEGIWTALREANEEIGLPLPPSPPSPSSPRSSASHLLHLTTLPAFTSRTLLVVLPIVYLLLHPASSASQSYLPSVLTPNPAEVDAVFHLPLRAFLGLSPPPATTISPPPPSTRTTRSSTSHSRPPPGTETLSHSFADYTWLLSRPYRLHSFSHPFPGVTPSAVTGLTADICIEVALLAAYGPRSSSSSSSAVSGDAEEEEDEEGLLGFERFAPGQMKWGAIVEEALKVDTTQGRQKGLGRETEAENTRKVEVRAVPPPPADAA